MSRREQFTAGLEIDLGGAVPLELKPQKKLTRAQVRSGHVSCAYCGEATPPERQAAAPWDWPGRGRVTNCKSCAGEA